MRRLIIYWNLLAASRISCIDGIILGELESPQGAEEYAGKMKNCPYLLFSVAEGITLCSAYVIKARKSSSGRQQRRRRSRSDREDISSREEKMRKQKCLRPVLCEVIDV
jgi:hypothetical protein